MADNIAGDAINYGCAIAFALAGTRGHVFDNARVIACETSEVTGRNFNLAVTFEPLNGSDLALDESFPGRDPPAVA